MVWGVLCLVASGLSGTSLGSSTGMVVSHPDCDVCGTLRLGLVLFRKSKVRGSVRDGSGALRRHRSRTHAFCAPAHELFVLRRA